MIGGDMWDRAVLELGHEAGDGAAESYALFLDLDGTIVDIAPCPDCVVIEPGLVETLAALSERLGGALALVSGRSIATLDALLSPCRFDAAGLHGAEWRCGALESVACVTARARLRGECERIARRVKDLPGVVIEDKGASIALHYRQAPTCKDEVQAMLESALERIGDSFRLQSGRAVLELVPTQAGKLKAIARFLAQRPYRGRRPVFAGDDETDEAALTMVERAGGMAIWVGRGAGSGHSCHFDRPADLRRALAQWARSGMIPFQDRGAGRSWPRSI
jgi:trehalose 6-phosphate phosphatase